MTIDGLFVVVHVVYMFFVFSLYGSGASTSPPSRLPKFLQKLGVGKIILDDPRSLVFRVILPFYEVFIACGCFADVQNSVNFKVFVGLREVGEGCGTF